MQTFYIIYGLWANKMPELINFLYKPWAKKRPKSLYVQRDYWATKNLKLTDFLSIPRTSSGVEFVMFTWRLV
ncbi:hypothetical protein Hanom_Chr16g01450801 [Helianthus anomalus]